MSDAHEPRPADGVERPGWQAAQPRRTPPAARGQDKRQPAPTTLLLVDREPTLREALLHATNGPATVLYAQTLAQARALLQQAGPHGVDVAVIDPDLDDGSGLDLAGELLGGASGKHPATQALVVSASNDIQQAQRAMRAGATDYLLKDRSAADLIDAALLADRVRAALTRRDEEKARQNKLRRLKKLCRRLDAARNEVSEQVDILCNDLVTAYQELAVQMQDAVHVSGFSAVIDGELDLETVLRKTLEHLVSKAGPCNAAIFLPANLDEYSLGGYVNYDCPKDAADMLLQHLADVLAPRIGEHDQLVHVRDNPAMQALLGDDWHYLADSRLMTFACMADDEPLAVVALFRDESQPFPETLAECCRTVADVLGETLARIIRVHHRASPDEVYGEASTGETLDADTFLPLEEWDGSNDKPGAYDTDSDEYADDDDDADDEDLPF